MIILDDSDNVTGMLKVDEAYYEFSKYMENYLMQMTKNSQESLLCEQKVAGGAGAGKPGHTVSDVARVDQPGGPEHEVKPSRTRGNGAKPAPPAPPRKVKSLAFAIFWLADLFTIFEGLSGSEGIKAILDQNTGCGRPWSGHN